MQLFRFLRQIRSLQLMTGNGCQTGAFAPHELVGMEGIFARFSLSFNERLLPGETVCVVRRRAWQQDYHCHAPFRHTSYKVASRPHRYWYQNEPSQTPLSSGAHRYH